MIKMEVIQLPVVIKIFFFQISAVLYILYKHLAPHDPSICYSAGNITFVSVKPDE